MELRIKIVTRDVEDKIFTHKELEADVNAVCSVPGERVHDLQYPARDMCVVEYDADISEETQAMLDAM